MLYSRANPEQRFLLDFGLGTGFRDGEFLTPNTKTSGTTTSWKLSARPISTGTRKSITGERSKSPKP